MQVASLDEFDWIPADCTGRPFTLDRYVPAGYSHYCQVRHPATVPPDVASQYGWPLLPGATRMGEARVSWASLSSIRPATAHSVAREIEEIEGAESGLAWLGAHEVYVLAEWLGDDEIFFYWDEVSVGKADVNTCLRGTTADWKRFADMHEAPDDYVWSPTYAWPSDRRWLLWTSDDLCYSVLACSDAAFAQALMNDPRIEVVPILDRDAEVGSL